MKSLETIVTERDEWESHVDPDNAEPKSFNKLSLRDRIKTVCDLWPDEITDADRKYAHRHGNARGIPALAKFRRETRGKQNRLGEELGEVGLEIACTERELLHDWLAQHPEHAEGQLIDYTIRGAPSRKQQIIKAKIHHVDVSVFGSTAHFGAQVFLPKDGGWELSNRRVSLGTMEIK